MKIIFLDIDGVINILDGHLSPGLATGYYVKSECLENFNTIIRETDARVVVSSSWRYLILNGDMTAQGFFYMLRTHGLCISTRILGATRADYDYDTDAPDDRGQQILEWLRKCEEDVDKYIILDDTDDGIAEKFKEKFIKVDSRIGLTEENAKRAIELLNGVNESLCNK